MMKKTDVKLFAKLMTEYIDEEIRKSKLIHEADETTPVANPATAVRSKQFATAYGSEPSQDPGPSMEATPPGKYATPTIPDQYKIFTDDAANLAIINHAMLARTIDLNYFYSDEKGMEPQPLLIWGAPGIGKSTGVKDGAIKCAAKVAKQKGLKFIPKMESLKKEYSNPESFKTNFYFLEWSKISSEDKELIMQGPPTEEEDLVHKGQKIRVNQYELRIPAENLFIFFDVRAAGTSDQDILGIPFRVDQAVRYDFGKLEEPRIIMQRLPFLNICCNEKNLHGVIMWDEINQASDQTQSALYSVILDRVIGDSKLAPGIGQFAAANGKMWGGQETKPALASRFDTAYLWLSPEEWMVEHKDKLPPIMYNFISDSPTVSFYITKEGWEKHYAPKFKRSGKPLEMSEYIQDPGLGRWPNPRDLTTFAKQFKDIIQKGKDEKWDQRDIIEAAVFKAKQRVGSVWAEQFRKYAYESFAVKWETLLADPAETARIMSGTGSIELARGLLTRHLKKAYALGKTVHNRDNYKQESADVAKVFIYSSTANIDIIMTVINRVKEELNAEKTGDTPEQINSRIIGVITDGIAALEPALSARGRTMLDAIKRSLSETNPAAKAAPVKKLQTGDVTAPGAQPELDKDLEAPKDEIPEKHIMFKKLVEELTNSMTKQPTPEAPKTDTNILMQKQKESMINLAKKVDAFIGGGSVAGSSADESKEQAETRILDFINKEIMGDTILTKEQKQKLISVIKGAPSSINAMQIISAYTTGNIFKLA